MEILLGILAALGACVILWCVALLILSPISGRNMFSLWYVSGTCEELEYRVRLCLLLQRIGLFTHRLVLVDCGLLPEARHRAELLLREQPMMDLVRQEDLKTYFDFVSAE